MVFAFVFIFFLFSISLIYASEEAQVEKAYACLDSKTNTTDKCSRLSFEEKVFSLLATGNCLNETMSANFSNKCWPGPAESNCDVKSTAQAVLALNEKNVNTTKAEDWLLVQKAIPIDTDWFLEIESSSATTCTILYSGSPYTILIAENKTISSNAGPSLTLAQNNYWLNISSSIYNKNIDISCDKPFITTLLFKKKDSSTVHVSETVHSAAAKGKTTEIVNSFCFSKGGVCDYEGSLWASLVLHSLKYDVSKFMPYLITMMDNESNQVYAPESFLYLLTGKFREELLLKQNRFGYWDVSGVKYNKYYDTALALWPFYYESPIEKENSKSWLLGVQGDTGQNAGCWNNNVRDTAFILYSVWPKSPSPLGECTINSDCPAVSCQDASCSGGVCNYEYNNDCPTMTCSTANDCSTNYVLPDENQYCSLDKTQAWKNDSKWSCDICADCPTPGKCVVDETPKKVDTCNSSEECYAGNCLSNESIPGCTSAYDCNGEDCVNGKCVPYECTIDSNCPNLGDSCIEGKCVPNKPLDCQSSNYYCMSDVNCQNHGGNILDNYACVSGLSVCCDTPIPPVTCVDGNGGTICASDESCIDGRTPDVSDTLTGETCCVGGTCEKKTVTSICGVDNNGICKSSCGTNEAANTFYTCNSGESCCVANGNSGTTSHLWIWILSVLILFSVLGIVFRDKLRAQLLRLKTTLGKKDNKKKFEMPMTPSPNMQRRIFPRGILPSQSRPPIRRPISLQTNKKPEEKTKNELDDVLKKLKEMGK